MIYTLLGIKKGMTSTYDTRGRRVGATIVKIEPNFVTQIKTIDGKDGYEAVQIGMGTKKSVKKSQIGHAKKAGLDLSLRWFKEVRIKPSRTASLKKLNDQVQNSLENTTLGQEINVGQVFFVGDSVKVTGTSKGKGFQGGVRRWGFHGGPKTHGQSDRHRAPGSIGTGTTPGRVLKGKKMAGHMGVDQVSYTGLEVVGVDPVKALLLIKGGVPGPVGALVQVEKQGRMRGFTPPPEEKEDEEEAGEAVKSVETSEVSEETKSKNTDSTEHTDSTENTENKGEENAG